MHKNRGTLPASIKTHAPNLNRLAASEIERQHFDNLRLSVLSPAGAVTHHRARARARATEIFQSAGGGSALSRNNHARRLAQPKLPSQSAGPAVETCSHLL